MGKIDLLLFEDVRCEPCRQFMEEVFPKIQTHYLNKNEIRFTLVPLAFLEGSRPLANAALAVYHISPNQFFPYLAKLSLIEQPTEENMLTAAKEVDISELPTLEQAILQKRYYRELTQNLRWARQFMGTDFSTPALFINGLRSSTHFGVIAKRIDALKGVQ